MTLTIAEVDISKVDMNAYAKHLADCLVITANGQYLFQKRTWGRWIGNINFFGGHVEDDETVTQGLIRELNEELGAIVHPKDIVYIALVTEEFTNHSELVHIHLWHDVNNTITGCYECESIEFDTINEALAYPTIMEYASWGILKMREKGLI